MINDASNQIICFGLGTVIQAVLLVRGNWEWQPFLSSLGFSLIGLLPGRSEHHYDPVFHLLYCFLLFSVFIAINFRKVLLPRVNEKILLVYTLTLWYAFFALAYQPGWVSYALIALFIAPTCVTLWLAATEKPLSFRFKLFCYGWYLLMVVFMVMFQFSYGYLLPFFFHIVPPEGSLYEAALAGMAFCYMLINATYLYQMLPIARKNESKEEAERRWKGWTDLMTGRYNDKAQLSHEQALAIVFLFGGLLAANHFYKLIPAVMAVNLGILVPLILIPGDVQAPEEPRPEP